MEKHNIRQRKDGLWEARYTVGGNRKSIYGKTQREAKMRLEEALTAVPASGSDLTFGRWLDEWQENWLDDVTASTASRYRTDIRWNIKPVIGDVPLNAITASQIKKVLKVAKDKGLAQKSVANIRIVIHRSLEDAVNERLIQTNPCTKQIKLPAYEEPSKEMRPLKDKEVPAFMKAIEGHPYEALFTVALFTGMRESELVGLTWDCVDFDTGTIHLYRQYVRPRTKGELSRFTKLKNKKARTFTPPPFVMKTLRHVQIDQIETRLKTGSAWDNPNGFVFTNDKGRPLTIYTIYDRFKEIVKQIGLPDLRFHDLRHTFATLSLQNGVDPKTVSAAMGHYSVAFTLDKYAHVTKTMQQQAADKMELFIANLG